MLVIVSAWYFTSLITSTNSVVTDKQTDKQTNRRRGKLQTHIGMCSHKLLKLILMVKHYQVFHLLKQGNWCGWGYWCGITQQRMNGCGRRHESSCSEVYGEYHRSRWWHDISDQFYVFATRNTQYYIWFNTFVTVIQWYFIPVEKQFLYM